MYGGLLSLPRTVSISALKLPRPRKSLGNWDGRSPTYGTGVSLSLSLSLSSISTLSA